MQTNLQWELKGYVPTLELTTDVEVAVGEVCTAETPSLFTKPVYPNVNVGLLSPYTFVLSSGLTVRSAFVIVRLLPVNDKA